MSSTNSAGPRVSFDIGGTFTDIVAVYPDGRVVTRKVLSILETLVPHVEDVIRAALEATGEKHLASLVHATTVASNALLENTLAKVGLITTIGFRDELELRREARPPVYDFGWERLAPIVPRRRRLEVKERVAADGSVHIPLDTESVREAVARLASEGVEAVAVCLINAHVNPTHEAEIVAVVRNELEGVAVCTSHEVLPQVREYERASTTAVNASLTPIVGSYLDRVEGSLARYSARLSIMQSNGGLMTSEHARRHPVRMIESGPAAGVLCAAALAKGLDLDRAVAFDMGGTTVKACLIEDGRPTEKNEYEVGGDSHGANRYDRGTGYAVAIPSFDIVEAGSGGGSIASAAAGALHVGPRSAGARPGPACYQGGGTEPTVTDANVVLGYINPTSIAGDTLSIDRDLALRSMAGVAGELGLTEMECAAGIHAVANAAMMRTIRAVTTERGHDPRDYAMIAFGGSGPVHAAALAELLGTRVVIVPPLPGLFSALGLLVADVRYDAVRNVGATLDAVDIREINSGFEALGEEILGDAREQGVDETGIRFERYLDLRYLGQSGELVVGLPAEAILDHETIAALFHDEHDRMFGYHRLLEPIKLTGLRLKAFAPMTSTTFESLAGQFVSDSRPWQESARTAYFGTVAHDVRVVPRRALRDGDLPGPAIVEEPDTTVVVPPGWTATANELGCIVMSHDRHVPA